MLSFCIEHFVLVKGFRYIRVDQMAQQIKKITFLKYNLKHAITIQSVQVTVKNFFQEETIDTNTDLNII